MTRNEFRTAHRDYRLVAAWGRAERVNGVTLYRSSLNGTVEAFRGRLYLNSGYAAAYLVSAVGLPRDMRISGVDESRKLPPVPLPR